MESINVQLCTVLKVLFSTGDYVQKNRFRDNKLQNVIQEFRLKLLQSHKCKDDQSVSNFVSDIIMYDLDTLFILKILYWLNFKDRMNQGSENRSIFKALIYTYSDIINSNSNFPSEEKSYLLTLIVQHIYQYYNLNANLNVNVEKN